MTYKEMSAAHQNQIDEFLKKYAFFAFSNQQFEEGLQKLNVKQTDLVNGGIPGFFLLKDKTADYKELAEAQEKELRAAVADPEGGEAFAYQMFKYELANHEYTYTHTTEEALDALGYTQDEIEADPRLKNALLKACQDLLK